MGRQSGFILPCSLTAQDDTSRYPARRVTELFAPTDRAAYHGQVDMDMPGCVYVHSPLNGQPGTVFAEEHTLVMVSSDLASGRSYTTVSEQPQQALETRSNGPQGTGMTRYNHAMPYLSYQSTTRLCKVSKCCVQHLTLYQRPRAGLFADTFRPKLDPLPDFDAPKMQDWFQRIDMTSYDTLNSMETWFEGLQSHAPSPQNLQTSPDRLVSGVQSPSACMHCATSCSCYLALCNLQNCCIRI